MLHGEISNELPLVIAFRFEGTVANLKTDKLNSFLRNKFKLKSTFELNRDVISIIERIYYRTEYTVDLVVERDNYDTLSWIFDNIPYSRIIVLDKPSQITARILMGDVSYYVDNVENNRNAINSRYAVDLKGLSSVLKF